MRLQSEDVAQPDAAGVGIAVESQIETSQTVSFIDNATGEVVMPETSENVVAKVDNTDDLSLGRFLGRPTLIDTTTWSTSDLIGVKTTFTPWYSFLNNAAIKKKIDNYAFLRGNLHLKVVVNGTPFQFGEMRLAYSPLLGWVSNKVRTNGTTNVPLLVPYSQQPGFFIQPQSNSGGELQCRFFLHKNWMDITSATEVQNMGTVNLVVYIPLGVAVTGGSTSVTVRTYAWMTDVELMGSTSKLSLQSRDEYGTGPVSLPASAIASAASHLSKIPVIGRFARATEIGAGAVSKIASLFGYTNVPVIEDVKALQPLNAPMLASAQIGVPIQKLTLDPKQELSIDPSFHGIGSEDELAMSSILRKESYFGSTAWSTSDTAGTMLWNARVRPNLFAWVPINNTAPSQVGTRVYHTPLSYVGTMFKHWRGDIKIRVKVVCTKFHKGRLKISYDPRGDISTSDPAENTVYTEILDIGEKDDVEFTIPYHQDLGWLRCDGTVQDNWTPGNPLAPQAGIDNGTITVRVLNTLTAPASSNIGLLFFVRAGDNFEYANPLGGNFVDPGRPPTFFALQSRDDTDIVATREVIGTPSTQIPERYGLNFGEAVMSLRTLLHRSQVSETTCAPSGTTGLYNMMRHSYRRMPFTPGFDPSSVYSVNKIVAASGTAPFAACHMTHLAYIAGMFLGYRGSVNYTVTPGSDKYDFVDDIRVYRVTDVANGTATLRQTLSTTQTTAVGATTSRKVFDLGPYGGNLRDGLGGMAITSTRTNGSIQFNFPDYNNYNFSLVDPTTYLAGNANDGTNTQVAFVQMNLKKIAAADADAIGTITLQSEVAAGPDFTCLHFLCCPTVDYADVPLTPV